MSDRSWRIQLRELKCKNQGDLTIIKTTAISVVEFQVKGYKIKAKVLPNSDQFFFEMI